MPERITHMLVLIDRKPAKGNADFVQGMLHRLFDKRGRPYSQLVDSGTKMHVMNVGPQDFNESYISNMALVHFPVIWSHTPILSQIIYQRFHSPEGNGTTIEEREISPANPSDTNENDITFSCPHCGQHIAIEKAGAGCEVTCPACNSAIMVPQSTVIKPDPDPGPKLEYFESDVPAGDGLCSDNACPCSDVAIPRGSGYLFIEQSLVDFRRQYPTLVSAGEAMRQRQEELGATFSAAGSSVGGFYRLGPILVCEQGARLRKLDLKVAAEDAKRWWQTGRVPLRATPISSDNAPTVDICPKCGQPIPPDAPLFNGVRICPCPGKQQEAPVPPSPAGVFNSPRVSKTTYKPVPRRTDAVAHEPGNNELPPASPPTEGHQLADAAPHPRIEQHADPEATVLHQQQSGAFLAAGSPNTCECGTILLADAPFCENCGRAQGWETVRLANEDSFKDLTCPKCPDILIPAKAVFLLHVLGKSISCPLCQQLLAINADKKPKWQLPAHLLARMPASENALIAEVKRLHKLAENKLRAEHLAETRTLPPEKQLAGAYLIHWLDQHHAKPSDNILNAILENWLAHFTLGMLANDSFPKLSPQQLQGFYVMMHYGSSLLHQVDKRISNPRVGYGMRAMYILNLLTTYEDWKNTPMNGLSYDGRLAVEEMLYSSRMESQAYPGVLNHMTRMHQHMQMLALVPNASLAIGCRKSKPRNGTQAGGCFIATAVYDGEDAPEVRLLRHFRDTHLMRSSLTSPLVHLYYQLGPRLAASLHRHPRLKPPVRRTLTRLVGFLTKRGLSGDTQCPTTKTSSPTHPAQCAE